MVAVVDSAPDRKAKLTFLDYHLDLDGFPVRRGDGSVRFKLGQIDGLTGDAADTWARLMSQHLPPVPNALSRAAAMQHFPGALGDLSFDAERGWILRIQTHCSPVLVRLPQYLSIRQPTLAWEGCHEVIRIRPNRHYQADRVFRAWDPVNPGLELVAPPGNYILRLDVPKGSMQFFAVVIRRDGSPNPGCPSNQDGDNFCDAQDNCPSVPNNDQRNQDGDSYGNFCDVCLTSSVNDTGDPASDNESNLWPDSDQDSVCDAVDNCPLQSNPRQWDNDGDGSGDACDNDDDNDQVVDSLDLCPRVASPVPGQNHVDQDGDGVGDECDVERTACYQSQCPSDGLCDYDPTTCLPRKPFTEAQAFVNRLSRALEHLDFDLIEGIPWDSFVGCVTPNCTLPTQVEVETLAAEVVEGREVPVTSWDDFQAVVELEAEKNAGFDLWDGELGGYLSLLYESQGSFLYR